MPMNPTDIPQGLKAKLHLYQRALICKHISENRRDRFRKPIEYSQVGQFRREDGTAGTAHWMLRCSACARLADADFVEHWWDGQRFHVSDFHGPPVEIR